MRADATGNLTLDLARDASGNITGGNVVFYVNYHFSGPVTITGLALHQGARGANGPVVLDAGVGSVTDSDGRGNLTKVVSGASATFLQALLSTPHGYYVDLYDVHQYRRRAAGPARLAGPALNAGKSPAGAKAAARTRRSSCNRR